MTSGNETTPASWTPRTDLAVATKSSGGRSVAQPSSALRWSRRRHVLGVFAAVAAVGFVAAYVGPTGVALSQASAEERPPISLYTSTLGDTQSFVAADAEPAALELDRGGYEVYVTPKPTPTPTPTVTESTEEASASWAPPFVTPDPGTAQSIAYDMVRSRGWGDDQFACLVALWNRESGWRVNAYNAGSGAYGIPQSLPGSKMASAGADWETNPATQISWGLGYIGGRYGDPCGAWGHSESSGWY